MAKVVDLTQAAGDFVTWLQHEHGVVLACYYGDNVYPSEFHNPYPSEFHVPLQTLLAQWQGIDLNEIEAERRGMLEAIRARHNEEGSTHAEDSSAG
jgi:hypothetical protein